MPRTAMSIALAILAITFAFPTLRAAEEERTHDGIVISATAGKLVMSDKEGKNEHAHLLHAACTVSLNGKPAKVVDLKAGDGVKVTVSEGAATKIVATRG